MAGIDLDSRRRIADAVEAAVRIQPKVRGQQLIDAGVRPGPWVGHALKQTRDAIVDGEIAEDQSLGYALTVAEESQEDTLE